MGSGYEQAHQTLRGAFGELALGRAGTLRRACEPDAQWWLPQPDCDRLPASDACRRLAGLVGAMHAIRIEAIVVATDARRAVVELVAVIGPGESETSVTSVLELNDGRVAAGRTYFDVAALT